MAETNHRCPGCGTNNPPSARFCGACGKPMAAQGSGGAPGKKATMVMTAVTPPAKPGSEQPAASQPGAPPSRKATMVMTAVARPPAGEGTGDASPGGASASVPAAGAATDAQPGTPATGGSPEPARPRRAAQRTMLGMAAVPVPDGTGAASTPAGRAESPKAADAPPAARPPGGGSQRTMLGMPAAAAPEQPATSGPPLAEAPTERAPVAARSQRTVLGMPQASAPPAEPGRPSQGSLEARSQRTVLGMPQASAPPVQPAGTPPAADAAGAPPGPGDSLQVPGLAPRRPSGSRGVLLVIGALFALLMLAGVAGMGWWWWEGRSAGIEVALQRDGTGTSLRIGVPGAPDGTKVRLRGNEATVREERASLPLPDDLRAGDNELFVEVVRPDGTTHRQRVVLTLRFHIAADTSTLGDWPPRLTVVVTAPKDTKVWLDDRPVKVGAEGRTEVALPVQPRTPDGPDTTHEHAVRYRVELPGGEERAGVLRTKLPVASLVLDRPGAGLVTDASTVTVAGTVAKGSRVRFDDRPVPVGDGRFETRWSLEDGAAGEDGARRHVAVLVVAAADRWPRRQSLEVVRVDDLSGYARRLARRAERLDYEDLRSDPEVHRGKRVALVGYAYNVQQVVGGGRGAVQMLARPCRSETRCPLWVTVPAGTRARTGETLLVVGRAAGMQPFRTRDGKQMTVPKVEAIVVAPDASAKPGGRHRRNRRHRRHR